MEQKQRLHTGWQRRAALFLASQNISLFGSSVVGFAVLWHITLETSSGVWIMLATLCSHLPQVLVSLWGGVWADRYPRKALIMLADGFIAFATLLLAVAFRLGHRQLWLLLVALAVRSVGAGVQSPAVNAMYPQIVPMEKLTKVQGINQTVASVCLLLSPAVGGALLGSVGLEWAFWLDVVTATVAILVLRLLKVEKQPPQEEKTSMLAELKAGVAYAFGNAWLRRIILCYAFTFFLITPAGVLSPLMVERTFGSEVWRLTANEVVWTVGSILGGVFVSLRGEFKNKVRTVAICLAAFGVMFALVGAAWNFAAFLVFMGIAGLFMPVIATAQTVHIQETTAPDMLGRAFSILQIISVSAMPVAILLFGPLADVVSVELLLVITGVLLAGVGVWYGAGGRQPAHNAEKQL